MIRNHIKKKKAANSTIFSPIIIIQINGRSETDLQVLLQKVLKGLGLD